LGGKSNFVSAAQTHKATLNSAFAIPNFGRLFISARGLRAAAETSFEGLKLGLCCRSQATCRTAAPVENGRPAFIRPASQNDTSWAVNGLTAFGAAT
jgi:hypothetical protein